MQNTNIYLKLTMRNLEENNPIYNSLERNKILRNKLNN